MNFFPKPTEKNAKEEIDRKFRLKSHVKDMWTVLHTSSVYLPEKLNEKEEQEYEYFVDGLLHFATKCDESLNLFTKEYIHKNKYNFQSRESAAKWLCTLHNAYNINNDKYLFECSLENLTQRYGNYSSINKTNNSSNSL
jgi:hypothetical protein